jgi:hypothetical protein
MSDHRIMPLRHDPGDECRELLRRQPLSQASRVFPTAAHAICEAETVGFACAIAAHARPVVADGVRFIPSDANTLMFTHSVELPRAPTVTDFGALEKAPRCLRLVRPQSERERQSMDFFSRLLRH